MKKMRKIYFILFIFICVGSLFPCYKVHAQTQAEYEDKKVIVKIGCTDFDEFFKKDIDGEYKGYGAEYLKKISKYTNWKYEIVYDSWEQQIENLRQGKIDFLCHASHTEKRDKEFTFSEYPMGSESNVLYVKKDNGNYYYNDYANFNQMTVGIIKGSCRIEQLKDYAKKHGFSYKSKYYANAKECFGALERGEVDSLALGSLYTGRNCKIVCQFGSPLFYFMANKENTELLKRLNEAQAEIFATEPNFLSDLREKYYANEKIISEVEYTRKEKEFIQHSNIIDIAFIPSRRPLSYIDENGNIAGVTMDIMKMIEKKSGLRFRYHMMEQGENAVEYMDKHPSYFIAGVSVDNEEFTLENTIVTDSFYKSNVVLVGRNNSYYKDFNGDKQYVIAINKSYRALKKFTERNYPNFRVIDTYSIDECVNLVREGKVDFFAQNINVVDYVLTNPRNSELSIMPFIFNNENTGMVAKKNYYNKLVVDILDKCIKMIGENDTTGLVIKHSGNGTDNYSVSDWLYKFRYLVMSVCIIIFIIIIFLRLYFDIKKRSYEIVLNKNRELAFAVKQAQQASEAKSRFLARMSHEMRTPLNAVQGLIDISLQNQGNTEKIEECLQKIRLSSKVLLNLINDVLDMSAIENSKLKIASKPFNIMNIISYIDDTYRPQCEQKGIEFEFKYDDLKCLYLIGDSFRVNQVLLNIVSNAYKFTASGGKISIDVSEKNQEGKVFILFKIKDTGEGMSESMRDNLFEPFEQEEAVTVRKHGGSGLGMAITKNLVSLMHGSITFESEKGKGTTFEVSIPFEIDDDYHSREAERLDESQEEYDFGGRRILLAEDTLVNAEIVSELLDIVNMKTDHAENGKEAVEMFRKSAVGTYCAILMDVQMPVMDGYEATREIRNLQHPEASTIPIFALTANTFQEDVDKALQAGMNGHIAKPLDTQALYRLLKNVDDKAKY